MDRVAAFFERKQPLIQLSILITLIATLVPISIQASVIRSEYEARTGPLLAIEDVSIEQDIDNIYVVIGIVNTGEIPAVNVKVDRMIMGGS